MPDIAKIYNPAEVEQTIYDRWIDAGCFDADADTGRPPFCIVIPPPNVTGQLHMGHALDNTLQDILIRAKRMQGYEALWMPGTDHAGIATQIKLESVIREQEGLSRFDLGREEFLRRIWEWKDNYGDRIVNQLKRLGASCDWRRQRFTMDEGCSAAVRRVFVDLYKKGLIYQGWRIINWCPACITSLSDAEVEYEEQAGHLWHIKYPLTDGGFLIVATTRPETMLGDTAVAVNPNDERYKALIGKTVTLPLTGREIPIVADDYVEPEFGTGCVKITPCHDPNDFEVAARHNLEQILVLDDTGHINKNGGAYTGLDRHAARRQIVSDLESLGLLAKIEPYTHNVGCCHRCGTTVEPMTSTQWFVKMAPMIGPAVDVVTSGELKFVPDRFAKIYAHWMEANRDWCISRQLWWGHAIPVFTCADCGEVICEYDDPAVCPKCGSDRLKQDPDVLDTWFSSALWPFSTLGWPEKTPELDYFYPTSVLVTGYDIIGFWVARMIFSGIEHMGKRPFDTCLIHGLVRDAQGRKMSKSLGNGIDPLEVIDAYGADALRFTLVTGNSPGNDMRFSTERVEASRNFANKLWNAARFVLLNAEQDRPLPIILEREDRWALHRLNELRRDVTDNIERFELGLAAGKLYDFIWDIFCDWYIELCKPRLTGDNPAAADAARGMLLYILRDILKLLHPFMPFITESIWQATPGCTGDLVVAAWPVYDPAQDYAADAAQMEVLMSAIRAIRNRRAEMNVPMSRKAELIVVTADTAPYEQGEAFIRKLAGVSDIAYRAAAPEDTAGMVSIVSGGDLILIPLAQLVDMEAERARLRKELDKLAAERARLEGKLGNEGFIAKAPEAVVAAERAKLAEIIENIAVLERQL